MSKTSLENSALMDFLVRAKPEEDLSTQEDLG